MNWLHRLFGSNKGATVDAKAGVGAPKTAPASPLSAPKAAATMGGRSEPGPTRGLERELQEKAYEEVRTLMHVLPAIRDLGNDHSPEALGRLLAILQFDAHGEIVIHSSLAIAGRPDKEGVKAAIKEAFHKSPVESAPWSSSKVVLVSSTGVFAGDTEGTGSGVFPRMRLLHPLGWMRERDFIRALLDSSGVWPRGSKVKPACYELLAAIDSGTASICEKLAYFEFLDEAGNRCVMEQTCSLYPNAGLKTPMWQCVRGRSG